MGAAPKHNPEGDDEAESEISSAFGHSSKKVEEGEGPWLVSYADLMTLLMGFFALIASMSTISKEKLDKVKESAAETFGAKYEKPYEKLGQDIADFIKANHLEDKVQVSISSNGAELTFTGTMFFESGDFIVKNEAKEIMGQLAVIIKNQPHKYKALIEGHTDSAPISHPIIASNWELSGIRAARIAQIFEGVGFLRNQLTIIGWGDTRKVANDTNTDGSLNPQISAKNRRVVLRVYDPLITDDPVRGQNTN